MIRPLLAPREDPSSYPEYFNKLRFPLLCSPKYDGIRQLTINNQALSRTGKLLPSEQVQSELTLMNNVDGEVIKGPPTCVGVYNRTQSYVMSRNKPGDIHYYVFDYISPSYLIKPFYQRLEKLKEIFIQHPQYHLVEHLNVDNVDELIAFEEACLVEGYEGIMMRDPIAHYKQGRGTFKEGIIYKLKRFEDAEGIILDIPEGEINNNIQEIDELGYSKRSTHKVNRESSGMAGGFRVFFEGQEIDVAPGSFSHNERIKLLELKDEYIGKQLKFRFFRYGVKDKPRYPRALGFRGDE